MLFFRLALLLVVVVAPSWALDMDCVDGCSANCVNAGDNARDNARDIARDIERCLSDCLANCYPYDGGSGGRVLSTNLQPTMRRSLSEQERELYTIGPCEPCDAYIYPDFSRGRRLQDGSSTTDVVAYFLADLEDSSSYYLNVESTKSCDGILNDGSTPDLYNNQTLSQTPWDANSLLADESGTAFGNYTVDPGLALDDLVGYAAVLYTKNGTGVACGILEPLEMGDERLSSASAMASSPFVAVLLLFLAWIM